MVRGPQPEEADPSSLLWCRDDNLFKRNFQYAKASAKENKKSWGLDFNPGPSAPRDDGTREAEENRIGPFANLDGLISYILVQGAKVVILTMMLILMKPQLLLQGRRSQRRLRLRHQLLLQKLLV